MDKFDRFVDYTDLGIIPDTPENRKQPTEVRIFPCYRCGKGNFNIQKHAMIYGESYSNAIISGTMPPIGYLKRNESFTLSLCEKCQIKEDKENSYYD